MADEEDVAKRVLSAPTYYAIFGVEKGAVFDETVVRKAYRKLAIKLHPDKNDAAEAKEAFQKVGEALSTLTDPFKRLQYDSKMATSAQLGRASAYQQAAAAGRASHTGSQGAPGMPAHWAPASRQPQAPPQPRPATATYTSCNLGVQTLYQITCPGCRNVFPVWSCPCPAVAHPPPPHGMAVPMMSPACCDPPHRVWQQLGPTLINVSTPVVYPVQCPHCQMATAIEVRPIGYPMPPRVPNPSSCRSGPAAAPWPSAACGSAAVAAGAKAAAEKAKAKMLADRKKAKLAIEKKRKAEKAPDAAAGPVAAASLSPLLPAAAALRKRCQDCTARDACICFAHVPVPIRVDASWQIRIERERRAKQERRDQRAEAKRKRKVPRSARFVPPGCPTNAPLRGATRCRAATLTLPRRAQAAREEAMMRARRSKLRQGMSMAEIEAEEVDAPVEESEVGGPGCVCGRCAACTGIWPPSARCVAHRRKSLRRRSRSSSMALAMTARWANATTARQLACTAASTSLPAHPRPSLPSRAFVGSQLARSWLAAGTGPASMMR